MTMRTYIADYDGGGPYEICRSKVVRADSGGLVEMVEYEPGRAVNRRASEKLGLVAREPKPRVKRPQEGAEKGSLQKTAPYMPKFKKGDKVFMRARVVIAPDGQKAVRPLGSYGTVSKTPRRRWHLVTFDEAGKALLNEEKLALRIAVLAAQRAA
jgi:hypothetical protein